MSEQYHTPPQYQEKAKVLGIPLIVGADGQPFDGTAEMLVESVEDYVKHMSEDEIVQAIISQ
jgi:hypothetical protein